MDAAVAADGPVPLPTRSVPRRGALYSRWHGDGQEQLRNSSCSLPLDGGGQGGEASHPRARARPPEGGGSKGSGISRTPGGRRCPCNSRGQAGRLSRLCRLGRRRYGFVTILGGSAKCVLDDVPSRREDTLQG